MFFVLLFAMFFVLLFAMFFVLPFAMFYPVSDIVLFIGFSCAE